MRTTAPRRQPGSNIMPCAAAPLRSFARSSPGSASSTLPSREEWSVRNPVTSSRFLASSTCATPLRSRFSPSTATPRSDFLNQHIERDRDQYKEQARNAQDQLAKLQDIIRYDVGEPRFLGTGNSNRTPILSDDLVTKVSHIQDSYYCAKEELEALWLEFEQLQSTTVVTDMLHQQRIEDDLKGAKIAIAKLRSGLNENETTFEENAFSESESEPSSIDEPSPGDLKALVEWQSRKIEKLRGERDVIRAEMESERIELEQFKRDMLISVRVADQFRKEAEHEAKQLRRELEHLAAKTSQSERRPSESAATAPVKAARETLLPIWALLKQEKPLGSRRNAFLEWCKERLSPYGIEVQNFSSHWNDGRAFSGLLHSFNSTYMPPDSMDKSTARGNIEYILKVATRLKLPEDKIPTASRLGREKPNWQDVMEFTAHLVSALLKNHPVANSQ